MNNKPAYRADVDGLRAVAVLSVVFYHYGAEWLPGGFTGVDVFFVISGFLITSIIRRELENGEFSLLAFYDRRIRRIAPALFVVLIASLAAGWFLLMPGDYAELGSSAAFAAVGFGNFFFVKNTGYFDQEADLQPLLHTWSLGVEEQFYLIWPVALWLATRVIGSRKLFLVLFVGGLAVAFAYAANQLIEDPKSAFYLPVPRAWELATGALVAYLPGPKNRLPTELASVAGMLLIAWSLLGIDAQMSFPGPNAVYACLGTALLLWAKQPSIVANALAVRPVVWFGLISYSLYLWHWPLLVLYRHYNNSELPGLTEVVGLFITAVIVSYLSWRFVEQPLRRRRLVPWKTVASGVALAGLVAVTGHAVYGSGGAPERVSPDVRALSGLDTMWEWPCTSTWIKELGNNHCTFGANWDSASARAILWGDSHAEHLAPLLQSASRDSDLAITLIDNCPAALGGSVRRKWKEVPDFVERCQMRRENVLRAIGAGRVDLLVLAASWNPLATVVSAPGRELAGDALVVFGLRELFQELSRMSKPPRVILVDQFPTFSRDPVACEIAETSGLVRKRTCDSNAENAYTWSSLKRANSFPGFLELKAEFRFLELITPREAMCSDGACTTRLNGEFLFRDANHIRRNLSENTLAGLANEIALSSAIRELAYPKPATP